MTYSRYWVVKNNARTRKTHNLAYTLTHILSITVRRALRAEGLILHARARQRATVGILGKGATFLA